MDFLPLLPLDILFNHIINLLDFTSRVRAAAVSPAWRDLLRAAPSTPAFSLPWLWGKSHVGKGKPFLIDVASSTFIPSRYHPSGNERVIASGSTYITLAGNPFTRSTRIWDPFTGKSCQLPRACRGLYGVIQPLRDIWGIQCSSRLPNCVIAAFSRHGVYLCRPGDKDWVEAMISMSSVTAMVFRKGLFYCFESSENIQAYDFTYMVDYLNGRVPFNPTLHCRQVAPVIRNFHRYTGGVCYSYSMVESDDELLVVGTFDFYNEKKVKVTVHRVDEENKKFVRVKDLGDRMLFIGSSSFACEINPGPKTSDSFFTKNSIYFLTHTPHCDPKIFVHHRKNCYRLGKFQLDSEICDYHPRYIFSRCPIWLSPPNHNVHVHE